MENNNNNDYCANCNYPLLNPLDKDPLQIEFKRTTRIMLLLTIISLGAYPFIWIYNRYKKFNALNSDSKPQISTIIVGILGILMILSLFIYLVSLSCFIYKAYHPGFSWPAFYRLQDPLLDILPTVIAYKMVEQLENYIKTKYGKVVKYNRFWTFFFHIFYVNFCIQDLDKRLSNI